MTSHFFLLQQVSRAFATTPKSPAEKEDHLEEVYQKLTQREHILKRPDSYSRIWREGCMVITSKQPMWVYDETSKAMKYKEVNYVPAVLLSHG